MKQHKLQKRGFSFIVLFFSLIGVFSGCRNPLGDSPTSEPNFSPGLSSSNSTFTVTSVNVSNNQLTLSGTNLDSVTGVNIEGISGFDIVSKSPSSVVAAAHSNTQFALGLAYQLLVSTAGATSPTMITFTIPNGSIIPAMLDRAYMTASGGAFTGPLVLPSNGLTVGSNQLVVIGGNVGIGTATPSDLLNVVASSSAGSGITVRNSSAGASAAVQIQLANDSGATAGLQLFSSGFSNVPLRNNAIFGTSSGFGILTNNGVATGGSDPIRFIAGGYSNAPTMTITSGNPGNVGIGTTTPAGTLDVQGGSNGSGAGSNINLTAQAAGNFGGAGGSINLTSGDAVWGAPGAVNLTGGSSNAGGGAINLTGGTSNNAGGININGGTSNGTNGNGGDVVISGGPGSNGVNNGSRGGNLTLKSGGPATTGAPGNIFLLPASGGNVGVGTTSPQATLDVNGYARLKSYGSPPVSCTSTYAGSIALNSSYTGCVCNGSIWIKLSDASACAW